MKRVDDLLKYLESYSDIAVVNKAKIHQELLLIKKEVAAINYTHSCKSDSELLPNMTLEQAIEKAKTNMDKIKDVDIVLKQ